MEIHTRVSVIIPVFNAEKYLSKCIDSILSQKCPGLELILVNDGSTDQSEQLIYTYVNDNRIVYLKQKNKGVSSARNYGMSYASGDYIIFVDADDYLVADSLNNRITQAEKTDLLISSYYREKAAGTIEKELYINEEKDVSMVEALRSISPKSTIGYQGFLWNKVFRRDIIKQNKIQFDTSIAYGEDRLFIGTYITHCKTIAMNGNCVYVYRINDESAMKAFNRITLTNYKRVFTELDALEKIEELVKGYDVELYHSFICSDFFTCVMFHRNSDNSVPDFKKLCRRRAWIRMREILLFPPSALSFFQKIKTVGHYILMR